MIDQQGVGERSNGRRLGLADRQESDSLQQQLGPGLYCGLQKRHDFLLKTVIGVEQGCVFAGRPQIVHYAIKQEIEGDETLRGLSAHRIDGALDKTQRGESGEERAQAKETVKHIGVNRVKVDKVFRLRSEVRKLFS